jgi:glycosyltransferase involved in cell wall biosynthesis
MRLVLLMNFVAPYRVELFEHLRDIVGEFRVLASTPMESDRHWVPEWRGLDVVVQRNLTFRRTLRDASGFSRLLQIHLPYDTIPQLIAYRPDAVITAELGFRSMQAVFYKWLRPGTPLLVWCLLSEHTERNWGRLRLWMRRFILRHADRVFVNGESGARYIARFGIPDARIIRINQPVELSKFINVAKETSAPKSLRPMTRLLHVGYLNERKGVVPFARHLIDWALANPDRRIALDWLGDGESRPELQALEWPANLCQRFLGNLPYSDVPRIYANADILVFPTLCDEWGLVVNEAMACGLPVLGSIYSQAVEELIVDGETGWKFDPLIKADVTRALDVALTTTMAQRDAMAHAARRRIAGLTPSSTAVCIAETLTGLGLRPSALTSRTSRTEPAEPQPSPAPAVTAGSEARI